MLYISLAGLGVLGVYLRFGLNGWQGVSLGTLLANVIGCLLIGFIYTTKAIPQDWLKIALMAGGLGALTTFSGFALEILKFWESGRISALAGYVVATNVLCIGAVFLGRRLAQF